MKRHTNLLGLSALLIPAAGLHAAPLISFDFSDFTTPVTAANSGTITIDNTGTLGAAGDGTANAFASGSITPIVGPAGAGDTAISFTDLVNSSGANGGRITFTLPAVTGDFTYAFSIRPDGDQLRFDTVFDTDNSNTDVFFNSNPEGLDLRARVGGSTIAPLADGEWQYVLVTYDADVSGGLLTLYVDNQEISTQAGVTQSFNPAASTVSLGSKTNALRPFNGGFDNFTFFGEALDEQARTDLFNATIPEPGALALVMAGAGLLGFDRNRCRA